MLTPIGRAAVYVYRLTGVAPSLNAAERRDLADALTHVLAKLAEPEFFSEAQS